MNGDYFFTNGSIHCMSKLGTDIYVGGSFSCVGINNLPANNFAKYDVLTNTWFNVGTGIDGVVKAVYALNPTHIYVGGSFTNNIIKWNGFAWVPVGNVVGECTAIYALDEAHIYVGGKFDQVNTTTGYKCIGMLNDSNSSYAWSQLLGGIDIVVNTTINTIYAFDWNNVYVGGIFTSANGSPAYNIAKWTGTAWSNSPLRFNNVVNVIKGYKTTTNINKLYIGGEFTVGAPSPAVYVQANYAVIYDGSTFSQVGALNGPVYDVEIFNDSTAYFIGNFTSAGSFVVNYLTKWNGIDFSVVNNELLVSPTKFIVVNPSNIYFNGSLHNNITKFDGTTWDALGFGVNGVINTMYETVDSIYVGGKFITVRDVTGIKTVNNIARWDKSTSLWYSLNYGITGSIATDEVFTISGFGTNIYVGGKFSSVGFAVNNIAQWNVSTSSWSAMGDGFNDSVHAIYCDQSYTYAGGKFTLAGGLAPLPFKYIARWDVLTSLWSQLTDGINVGSAVYAIKGMGTNIYVGGKFVSVGLTPIVSAINIAKWDVNTTLWSAVGSGITGTPPAPLTDEVRTICGDEDNIFAGGSFVGSNIKRYTSISGTWASIGVGVDNTVNDLKIFGNKLYVVGKFTFANNIKSNHVAVVDLMTYQWSSFNCGLGGNDAEIKSVIVVNESNIYFGGNFMLSGARYTMRKYGDLFFNKIHLAPYDTVDYNMNNIDFTSYINKVIPLFPDVYKKYYNDKFKKFLKDNLTRNPMMFDGVKYGKIPFNILKKLLSTKSDKVDYDKEIYFIMPNLTSFNLDNDLPKGTFKYCYFPFLDNDSTNVVRNNESYLLLNSSSFSVLNKAIPFNNQKGGEKMIVRGKGSGLGLFVFNCSDDCECKCTCKQKYLFMIAGSIALGYLSTCGV